MRIQGTRPSNNIAFANCPYSADAPLGHKEKGSAEYPPEPQVNVGTGPSSMNSSAMTVCIIRNCQEASLICVKPGPLRNETRAAGASSSDIQLRIEVATNNCRAVARDDQPVATAVCTSYGSMRATFLASSMCEMPETTVQKMIRAIAILKSI